MAFKKSLTIPRPVDYPSNRHKVLSSGQLQILPITYSFLLSISVFYPPLPHSVLYFLQHNFFPICKQNIHKALWEEIESRREKSEGCQHCQANTHLQSASHHHNTAVTTSVNVFSYAQKIWYGLLSFDLGI